MADISIPAQFCVCLQKEFFQEKGIRSHCPINRKMCRSRVWLGRGAGFSSRQGFPAYSLHFLQYNVLWCISGVANIFRTETKRKLCYHLLETGNRKFAKTCILQLFMFFIVQSSFYMYYLAFSSNPQLTLSKKRASFWQFIQEFVEEFQMPSSFQWDSVPDIVLLNHKIRTIQQRHVQASAGRNRKSVNSAVHFSRVPSESCAPRKQIKMRYLERPRQAKRECFLHHGLVAP